MAKVNPNIDKAVNVLTTMSQAKIETAKSLLKLGVDMEIVVKSTNLTKEKLIELQKEI